jgi:hypothetical protein
MLNEFDLKDWDKIDCEQIKKLVENEYDWATLPYDVYEKMMSFIEQVELIQKKQVKQVALLLKPKHCADFGRCNCLRGQCDKGLCG